MISIHEATLTVIGGMSLCLHAFGLVHAVDALMHVRSARATAAWMLGLVMFPYLALPLYWLAGRDRMKGYVRARNSGIIRLDEQRNCLMQILEEHRLEAPESRRSMIKLAEILGGQPLTRGNSVDLYVDGKETFEALFEAIASAKQELLVMYFIIKDDRVGQRFQRSLMDRARAGVKVRVLYDDVGSHKLSRKYLAEMRAAGIEVVSFGARRRWDRFSVNFRNHRKVLIVDGQEAFLGGLNVGDEYLGDSEEFGKWRDTHLRVEGPAVAGVKLVFIEDWHWATGQISELGPLPRVSEENDNAPLMIFPTGPADEKAGWQLFLIQAANEAKERLWISSPYFVPDSGVLSSLQAAALRGVEVKILIPEKPDHLLVWLATFTYLDQTLPYGIKIFRYQDGFLHQKALLVDEDIGYVGSANFDNRSLFLNFEIGAIGCRKNEVGTLVRIFENDMRHSREVKITEFRERSFAFHVACRAARLFSPVL